MGADPQQDPLGDPGSDPIVYPSAGAVGLVWAIGAYAILFGVLMLYLAFKFHGIARQIPA